jgi:predicted Fe-S protein YdhL (DUF1289 family)
MVHIISPCVRLCTLDPEIGICVGCGRSLDEIGGWMRLSDDERRAIMDVLPARIRGMERRALAMKT